MHRSNENETYKQNCMKLEESNSKLLRKIENQESKIETYKEQNFAMLEHIKLLDSHVSNSQNEIDNLELEISENKDLHALEISKNLNDTSMLTKNLEGKEKEIKNLSSEILAISIKLKSKDEECNQKI